MGKHVLCIHIVIQYTRSGVVTAHGH